MLEHLITVRLTSLAQDKAYVRQRLSQNEAKSVRPFLRQWDKLRQEPNYPSDGPFSNNVCASVAFLRQVMS